VDESRFSPREIAFGASAVDKRTRSGPPSALAIFGLTIRRLDTGLAEDVDGLNQVMQARLSSLLYGWFEREALPPSSANGSGDGSKTPLL